MGQFSVEKPGHVSVEINTESPELPSNMGWADVRHEVDFKHEARSGALLTVKTDILKIGRTSMTFRHQMLGPDGQVHAVMTIVTVCFNLLDRVPMPIPIAFKAKAEKLIAEA